MKKTLYMIGNAHIDPVWLWRWTDGFSEVRATFRSVLDRMNEYPDFVFTSAAGAYYEWIEQTEPEMFRQIQQRVQEGRWKLVGGWWIQPDCNIPCGESLARHALITQRYFQEKFGVTAHTGYNVDSFGHSGAIPKILRKSGMTHYVYMRPGQHEKAYPAWTFRWQSPEGESVSAFRIPFEYCTWGKELTQTIERVAHEVTDDHGMMCFYGVGNHGGGPTKENLNSIAELNGQDGVELRLFDPDAFFEGVDESRLPVVCGDLLHHASGCYAGHYAVKKWNRDAENRLLTAEKWASAARVLLGMPYDTQCFTKAWKKVLFNQFHDILAGCCLQEGYDDAREDFGYALSFGAEQINRAQQALMRAIEIPFEEGAFQYVVFNPHGFAAKAPVKLEVAAYKQPMALFDSHGETVPYQLTHASAAANGRQTLHFVAQVPAMGWQVYTMRPVEESTVPSEAEETLLLENDDVQLRFDPETGVTGLLLKPTCTEMLSAPVEALVMDDPSDTWSHAVLRFDRLEGRMPVRSVRVMENGEVFKTIRVEWADGDSALRLDFTLYHELPQIFVEGRLDWFKRQKLLKLHLPLRHNYGHVTVQNPFGFTDHPLDGVEYPMQEYVDLTGVTPDPELRRQGLTGLAVLNDGKSAYSAERKAIDITLVRSPYYANHEPFVVEEGMDYPTVDWGRQHFRLSLLPHAGMPEDGHVEEQAMLLNAPLTILPESAHDGTLAKEGSVLALEAAHTVIDAVKLAEDGSDALIIHLHETARREESVRLRIPSVGCDAALDVRPGEIRVLRVSLADGSVSETNLTELA